MKRREALKKTSWMLKATICAPAVLTALQNCQQGPRHATLLVFDDEQEHLVRDIADTIIPRTATPSASDVSVSLFMDVLLQDVFTNEEVQQFLQGLEEFNNLCRTATGYGFEELDQQQQTSYLEPLDREVMSKAYEESVPFYYTFKQLTCTAYFTSEQGAKQNLHYIPIPGPYQGDILLNKSDKISVGNNM